MEGASSVASDGLLARDPDNRLLARGPRFRLPAEFIRDAALRAGGLLVDHVLTALEPPFETRLRLVVEPRGRLEQLVEIRGLTAYAGYAQFVDLLRAEEVGAARGDTAAGALLIASSGLRQRDRGYDLTTTREATDDRRSEHEHADRYQWIRGGDLRP